MQIHTVHLQYKHVRHLNNYVLLFMRSKTHFPHSYCRALCLANIDLVYVLNHKVYLITFLRRTHHHPNHLVQKAISLSFTVTLTSPLITFIFVTQALSIFLCIDKNSWMSVK